jgi:hypothetical protein
MPGGGAAPPNLAGNPLIEKGGVCERDFLTSGFQFAELDEPVDHICHRRFACDAEQG